MLINGSKPNLISEKHPSCKGYKLSYWDDRKDVLEEHSKWP